MTHFSPRGGWRALGWFAAWVFFFTGMVSAQTHPWRDHLTRDDVLQALGEPNSDLRGSGHEEMDYKGGLVIELQNGEVTNITGTVPDSLKPMAAQAPAAAVTAPAPAPVQASTARASAAPTPVSVAARPTVAAPADAGPAPATGDQDSEKIISDFSNPGILPPGSEGVLKKALGQGGDGGGTASGLPTNLSIPGLGSATPEPESPWSQANSPQGFLAGFLLKAVVMTFVLKGIFAYKDFPILWREVALVAAGVALCNEVMAFLFTLNDFLKILGWVQADQLVAGVVLLTLIMNFTSATRVPTAVGITVAAMAANVALQYAQLFFF